MYEFLVCDGVGECGGDVKRTKEYTNEYTNDAQPTDERIHQRTQAVVQASNHRFTAALTALDAGDNVVWSSDVRTGVGGSVSSADSSLELKKEEKKKKKRERAGYRKGRGTFHSRMPCAHW